VGSRHLKQLADKGEQKEAETTRNSSGIKCLRGLRERTKGEKKSRVWLARRSSKGVKTTPGESNRSAALKRNRDGKTDFGERQRLKVGKKEIQKAKRDGR